MILAKLKEILDKEFGAPFLPKGMVKTKWIESTPESPELLEIKIGRRDVWVDEKLKVHASGTDMTC